jgi:hypothetical protein
MRRSGTTIERHADPTELVFLPSAEDGDNPFSETLCFTFFRQQDDGHSRNPADSQCCTASRGRLLNVLSSRAGRSARISPS